MLLMSAAKFFGTEPADFLVAAEQKPRLYFGTAVDFDESKDTATIVAANALRTHQNIFVSGKANVLDGFFVNGVEMSDAFDENEIAFAKQSVAFEIFWRDVI